MASIQDILSLPRKAQLEAAQLLENSANKLESRIDLFLNITSDDQPSPDWPDLDEVCRAHVAVTQARLDALALRERCSFDESAKEAIQHLENRADTIQALLKDRASTDSGCVSGDDHETKDNEVQG